MQTRRQFVTTTLGAGAALATGSAKHRPRAGRPPLDHRCAGALWKAETPDWKWVPGLVAQLPEPFTIERLVPMMDEAGVDRVVIVPPSWPGDRNDYALEAVKRYPNRFRVMGRIPLQDPKSAELLPKWKEQQGMVGVRLTFNTAQNIPWLTDGTADWFWPAAEKAGLPVMCFAPGNTKAIGAIAERHPQLQIIFDHMNTTGGDAEGLFARCGDHATPSRWRSIRTFSVKVSASPGLSREPYPFRDVAIHIKRCFDAYGPQRCYWGTDMTNSYAKANYRQRITQFTEQLNFLNENDKDWVMGRAIMQRLKWT